MRLDFTSRINGYQLSFLAGFTWGYTENIRGEVSLLDFGLLTEKDWDIHNDMIAKQTTPGAERK